MRELLYNRYWKRIRERASRRGPGVMSSWNLFGAAMGSNFMDFYADVPGTVPEKIIYSVLVQKRINFYYGWWFGDLPFTEEEENYIPDFLLPDYNIIIEVQGAYWHSRPGQWEKDYQRALWLTAAGYKVYAILDYDILSNPYQVLSNIPELRNAVTTTTTKYKPSPRPTDPAAALKARNRKYPKVIALKYKSSFRKAGKNSVLSSYRAAAARIPKTYSGNSLPFTSEDIDVDLAAEYIKYGTEWKDYIEDLGDYFSTDSAAKQKAYPDLYEYYMKWKGWWYRYGRAV